MGGSDTTCDDLLQGASSKEGSSKERRYLRPEVTSDTSAVAVRTELLTTICNIRELRKRIEHKIRFQRGEQAGFDSSIITAGLGAVAAALYAAPTPVVGGFALAGSGLTAYRNYYNPEKLGSHYIIAIKSARCISSKAEELLNVTPESYWQQMALIQKAIANVQTTSGNLTGASQAETDGKDAATKAIAAAEAAFASMRDEAEAFNNAPSVIDQAHDAVKNYIDESEHRADVQFSDIQSQLNASLKDEATSMAQTEAARVQLVSAAAAQGKAQGSADQAQAQASKGGAKVETPEIATVASTTTTPDSLGAAEKPQHADQKLEAATASSAATREAALAPATSNRDAKAKAADTAKTDAIALALNAKAVTDLNSETEDALKLNPASKITSIDTAITTCVAAVQN